MIENGSVILEGLNGEQRKAVECVDGPVLIVAGAGSGKTRVLTSRVAWTIANGTDPARILALTFTKKAAGEMKERIADMVGAGRARRIVMGTFHSVFVRFLREFPDLIGYPASFTIYDAADSANAVKTVIREMKLDENIYKPKEVLSRISMAKNHLVTAALYAQNDKILSGDRAARKPEIANIYLRYDRMCRASGVMDFDDILLNMYILLQRDEARVSIAGRFDYILVDEYQDTNLAQYRILKELCRFHHNLCVVGDDSQSIYAFRGARIENILHFRNDFPELKVFRLERNYRSTQMIVNAANSLIAKNENRIPKTCVSVGETGEKIRLIRAYTETEEALLVASSIIERMQAEKAGYRDFAILYRTNSQSRALEEALRKRNLPYRIWSGNSFFERAEVKDMMAYFKLTVNPDDNESFRRIVNKPVRGIGDTSLAALQAAAASHGVSLFRAAGAGDLADFGLKPRAIEKIRSFCDMIGAASVRALQEDAHTVALSLAGESGLYAFYKADNSIEGQSRTANVEELLNSVTAFIEEKHADFVVGQIEDGVVTEASEVVESDLPPVLLADFLEDVSLLSNVDVDEGADTNRIALMTAHSAKGLEFPFVYITGLEENLFPSGSMLSSERDIEEERRLFYVALTRAQKAVTLTYATTRMRNGRHENNAPSRFLREIAPQYLVNPLRKEDFFPREDREEESGGFGGFRFGRSGAPAMFNRTTVRPGLSRPETLKCPETPKRPAVSGKTAPMTRLSVLTRPLPPKIPDSEFIPTPMERLKEGQRIEHNRFGPGRILEITGTLPDLKARVVFDGYGEKILLLKYAKIRVVSIGNSEK